MSGHLTIRPETPQDFAAIDEVIGQVFGGDGEVVLVRRLRGERNVVLERVAEDGGAIVGHILLSHLMTEIDGRAVRAVALAPVSVAPDRQNQGIGGQLIRAALAGQAGQVTYPPAFGIDAKRGPQPG